MRSIALVSAAFVAVTLTVAPLAAQGVVPVSRAVGTIEFGTRAVSVDGDDARFNRYQDLRTGGFIDRFRYSLERGAWMVETSADHVGYRDQRYAAVLERPGRLRVSVLWDQVPMFLSDSTRTPYSRDASGALRLPEGVQASAQAGAATLRDIAALGEALDMRVRRHTANLSLTYAATPSTEVRVGVTSTGRQGEQPWGGAFGLNLATEFPRPIDERTNDVNATLEWASGPRTLRVAYDGSFYTNDVQSLVWDNPLRSEDRVSTGQAGDGGSQGRYSLPPSNTAHTVSAIGSVGLPARSRAHAYVSVGQWTQNEALLPHTINTAIEPVPLSRATAEAEARVVSANVAFTSRPVRHVWLNARMRVYDLDNRTPRFLQPTYVRADQNARPSVLGGSEAFGYTRSFFDVDASVSPLRWASFQIGYGREHDDRTFRFLEETTEHTMRASVDTHGLSWLSVRALYEHGRRTGEGFDEEAFSEIGEQLSLRQFDISDRIRNRLTTVVYLTPMPMLGVSGSMGIGTDHRPDATFGLQDNDHQVYGVGVDVAVNDETGVGVSYDLERYESRQQSRQANPGADFNDPRRDWSTDMTDRVHTLAAHADLPRVLPWVSLAVEYDYTRSRSRYAYLRPPDSTLATPQPLTPVLNRLQHARVNARRAITSRITLGVTYAYDRYDVEDFAYPSGTLEPLGFPGSGLYLGAAWRPYRAHGGWLRVIYDW